MEGDLIWFTEFVISLNKPRSPQDQVRNLLIGRKSVQFLLREEEVAVHGHLKDPPRAFDQLWLNAVEGTLQLGDQTGRLRVVASLDTEFDLNVHEVSIVYELNEALALN